MRAVTCQRFALRSRRALESRSVALPLTSHGLVISASGKHLAITYTRFTLNASASSPLRLTARRAIFSPVSSTRRLAHRVAIPSSSLPDLFSTIPASWASLQLVPSPPVLANRTSDIPISWFTKSSKMVPSYTCMTLLSRYVHSLGLEIPSLILMAF